MSGIFHFPIMRFYGKIMIFREISKKTYKISGYYWSKVELPGLAISEILGPPNKLAITFFHCLLILTTFPSIFPMNPFPYGGQYCLQRHFLNFLTFNISFACFLKNRRYSTNTKNFTPILSEVGRKCIGIPILWPKSLKWSKQALSLFK